MAKVAIIGAGAMGLAAAYYAAKFGHRVVVYEADNVPGGMAAHFDFGGLSIERYYHFICKSDQSTFDLMRELRIDDRLRWVSTSMGYFINGRLHDWGNPVALMKFPHMSLVEKVRYGLMMFAAVQRRRPGALENVAASRWIEAWCGPKVYRKLWRNLLELKFYEHADNVSAAWIWTRIKRVGTSRRSVMREELGYIDGGTATLINALVEAIKGFGADIRLGAPVDAVTIASGRVTGVRSVGRMEAFDSVISTAPIPFVSGMIPDLPPEIRKAYGKFINIGVACVIFKLKRSVSRHFWVNVADPEVGIPGFVEFSNLRPTGDAIVYVPYYMPVTHPNWARSNDDFLDQAFGYLKRVNPALVEADRLDARVGRLTHAQPICPPGFGATIPSVQTPIAGLQVADTCFYYPEDRGISESVRFGALMARAIDGAATREGET